MLDLSSIYKPITAQYPYKDTKNLPCEVLKPYIATYWGTEELQPVSSEETVQVLVIPDTCADIIYEIDYKTNQFTSRFCGMNDRPFTVGTTQTGHTSCFAVRFHFWAISLFANAPLENTLNIFADPDIYFKGWDNFFRELLLRTYTLKERIPIAEKFLLSKLNLNKMDYNVMNAAYSIINSKGANLIKEASCYTAVSQRQLERLFLTHVGLPVKKVSNLIRYQNVWQDIVYSKKFDIQDVVIKYGFTDQSHLINEFKKYHGITPGQAKRKFFEHM